MAKAKRQSQKSWRKRGAVLEEAALRVRRKADQERRTGGSISNLSDSQLFAVDASGGRASGTDVSRRKALRSGAAPKVLHVDRLVATNPYLQPVVKAPPSSAKPSALSNGAALVKGKITKAREKVSRTLAHRAARAATLAAAPAAPSGNPLDIWGAAPPPSSGATFKVCQRNDVRRKPESSTVTKAVVPVPDGASWNPSHEGHQELLAAATEHELARQRKEQHHRYEALFGTGEDFEGRVAVPIPPEALREDGAEDSEDEDDEEEDDDDEDDEDEEEEGTAARQVERAPVTAAQRKKRERQKERERAAAAAKREKRQQAELDRVEHVLGEIKRDDKALRKKQQAEAAWEAVRPKKLGPKRYAPKRPDVLLTDELPASYRNLETEGSLLADRFESIQARNMVEVREQRPPPQKRKRRMVLTEKAKDAKYKSPFGQAGPTPAWL